MKFDSIIIGGGVAGLSCAIRCAEAGMKTAVIAAGQSALHFSSGSVDVLSRLPNGEQVNEPFASFGELKTQCPSHPYSKLGELQCREAINWYQDVMARCGVYLTAQADEKNHYRVTPMGTFRSTWLSQQTVHQFPQDRLAEGFTEIALVTVDGFRDFQPQLAADNLSKLSAFEGVKIKTAAVELPDFDNMQRNPCEFRSIDISRVLRDETKLHAFAKSMIQQVGKADLVVLPAVFGNGDGAATIKLLEGLTGFKICELPTMPPSLLGIRLEEAMKSHYKHLGGLILAGDEVLSGEFDNHRLAKIFTRNHEDIPLVADHFLLASGSFFSKGLSAQRHEVSEPIFGLDMADSTHRDHWYQPQFFTPQSHPFMKMGIDCNNQLNPSINNQVINNLYCAGAILAHYDPVQEGSGSGVAISTGYYVAQQMINVHQHQEQHPTETLPKQERTTA
ncbi:glycerol-3-phosphate dehydrogenase subunit GlpB [Photobacterium lutimaris]|uniref:Anaerobic glycerol-3-phosphate dehydrogenase subunit B n=1 Tax=Photobacterium lutimaris TaxID=388278 RepID=A0A2T3J1P9_9GAMM|nr:glycerol-3-phosphate dehydrogenase subunit GlpB [Photobacterium lutimaris]PSU34998.1 anaerobic glycerol-3-phosphate dehydrogenase subunit B [Photobacterium lutimaris]TDR77355.1 glycerol 3-phosphate dehydrogenase (quinone) subunit B [Photobacterium lutimaris]